MSEDSMHATGHPPGERPGGARKHTDTNQTIMEEVPSMATVTQ